MAHADDRQRRSLSSTTAPPLPGRRRPSRGLRQPAASAAPSPASPRPPTPRGSLAPGQVPLHQHRLPGAASPTPSATCPRPRPRPRRPDLTCRRSSRPSSTSGTTPSRATCRRSRRRASGYNNLLTTFDEKWEYGRQSRTCRPVSQSTRRRPAALGRARSHDAGLRAATGSASCTGGARTTTIPRRARPSAAARGGAPPCARYGVVLLLLSPWIIGFLLFTAGPMLLSLFWSFTHYDMIQPGQLGRPRQLPVHVRHRPHQGHGAGRTGPLLLDSRCATRSGSSASACRCA